ncbi:chromosome condensation regulator RCC1 [Methanocella arvoryzae]|uniref:chromosome condensation regulator RCC1 n=1 Tax=Methanocella arvoryzae TaxID=1175445 RepID=UPI001E592230|nr:chromosome condensation regulator RCC1 [Methanocella arvoryzae]
MALSTTASAITVTEVCALDSSGYAIGADGDLWVWGYFLGEKYVHPTKVPLIDHVKMVASGVGGAVVLKDDGTVWAWGMMPASQAGSYPGENSTTPVQINIADVKSIASTGNTVYMVKTDGSLWMCGRELCLSFDDIRHSEYTLEPVQLSIGNVSRVVPTISFVYVQKDDGSWWSWGENRDYQLNDGTNVSRELPVQMQLDNVKLVCPQSICFGINDYYMSDSSVLALDGTGQVYGWGKNNFWVSGDSKFPTYDGTNDDGDPLGYVVPSPHPVPGMSDVREIDSGVGYYVALKKDGTIWAWGSNPNCYDGQASLDSNTPVQLSGFSDIVAISTGDMHLLAVKNDGTVWAWGSNCFGELGNGEISQYGGKPYAVQVTDLYVDLPGDASSVSVSSTPTPVPDNTTGPVQEADSTGTPTPAIVTTASPTPVPLPDVSPVPATGFDFSALAVLGCLLVTAGITAGFLGRKREGQ